MEIDGEWEEGFINLKGLGDFHLRSALVQPNLEDLQSGKGRNREVKSIRSVKDKTLHLIDPGRLLSLIIYACQLESNDRVELPYLDELILLLEEERKCLKDLSRDNDVWDGCIKTLKGGSLYSVYTCGRLQLQLVVLYSLMLNSQRDFKEGKKMFTTDGVFHMIRICGIPFWVSGEFVFVPYNRDLLWNADTDKSRGEVYEAFKGKGKKMDKIGNYPELMVLTLDMLRMMCDKISERENVDLANQLGSPSLPEEYPPITLLYSVWSLLDNGLWEFGNQFYKFVKTYEAIVTGVILEKRRGPFSRLNSFLDNTITNLEPEFQRFAKSLASSLWDYTLSIHHETQIYGLFRAWGHPVVDTMKGIKKVFELGGKEKIIDDYLPKEAQRKFREIFFCTYRAKEGNYPKHEIIEENYVTDCLKVNMEINKKHPRYSLQDWDGIEVKKTFDIPQTYNLSMIIADKAISADRDEMRDLGGDATKILDPYKRRGVLKWIKKGMVNCKDLLYSINAHKCGLPKRFRVIGLYPKEREINPVARMFSLMSLLMRAYVVVTENMLSEHILPYIPGVTMTYDLLDLTKAMIVATRDMFFQGKQSRTFSINIDFEKWNLNFRQKATAPVFEDLGRLFGLTQLYNRTYDIFRNSVLYLSDGSYVPKFDENLDLIDDGEGKAKIGHLGGLEGLRQKGWTVFTAVVIAYVCDQLGIDYKLMGQGDNQVLIVKIYSAKSRFLGIEDPLCVDEINEKLETLIKLLTTEFLKLGLPIKPLETWVSDQFFSYGKVPIFRGLPCSMSLKKMSRIFAFSNEDMMTADNALGAIVANSQAAAMASLSFVVPYVMQKLQSLWCIGMFQQYHPLAGAPVTDFKHTGRFFKRGDEKEKGQVYINGRKTTSKDFRLMAVTIPRTFGGFNSVNSFHMIMRGFPDAATMDASWLFAMRGSEILGGLITNFLQVEYDHVRDYSYLIQDPEALNILVPPSTKTTVKNMVREQLSSIRSDTEASKLFFGVLQQTNRDNISSLCDKMTLNDNLNVRFLHDIVASTLFGYCDAISSKIDKTVTLSRLTSFNKDVVGAVARGEKMFWEYFKWRINHTTGKQVTETCPTLFVQRVRDEGWRKHIIGVTTPFPFHFLSTNPKEDINSSENGKIHDQVLYAVISEYALRDSTYLYNTLGRSLPYLGSVVKERLQQSSVTLAFGSEPLISRPVRLLRAIGWFISETSLWSDLIKLLVRSVSDLDPSILITAPEEVKGSMEHRYQDFSTSHGTFWGMLYGPCTHVNLSTNRWTKYQRDGVNYMLQYQAVLCYMQYVTINAANTPSGKKYMEFYECCHQCVRPVEENFPDLLTPVSPEEVPSDPSNPYLYIDQQSISLITRNVFSDLTGKVKVDSSNVAHHLNDVYWYLVEEMSRLIKLTPQGSGVDNDTMDISGKHKSIFKKIHPGNLMTAVLRNFWINYHTEENSGRRTPSWQRDKHYVVRKISSYPASHFSLLGNLFFWPNIMNDLRSQPWFSPPTTYPATPASLSESSKNSLIRLALTLRTLELPVSTIISHEAVRSAYTTKLRMCFEGCGKPRHKCTDCTMKSFVTRVTKDTTLTELLSLRCASGHTPYDPEEEETKMFTLLSYDQLAEKLPPPALSTITETIYTGKLSNFPAPTVVTSSGRVVNLHSFQSPYPSLEFNNNDWELRMLCDVQLPTRSFQRVLEVINILPNSDLHHSSVVLGDGYGWSSYAVKCWNPKSDVMALDLIDITSSPPHILHQSRPPVHYKLTDTINQDFAYREEMDIFGDNWGVTVETVKEQTGGTISLVLSEIELCHNPSLNMKGSYTEVVKRISLFTPQFALIKLVTPNLPALLPVLETASTNFEMWILLNSPEADLASGVSWLLCFNGVPDENVRFFDERSIEQISDDIRCHTNSAYGSRLEVYRKWVPHYALFNAEIATHRVGDYLASLADSWMFSSGLLSWNLANLTRMLHEVRHYKTPEFVVDHQGSDRKYYFYEDHKALETKLLALAMAACSSTSEVLHAVRREWRLTWLQEGLPGMSKDLYVYNPVLKRRKERMEESKKRDLLRHVAAIRNSRRIVPFKYTFTKVGKLIRFRYIPRSQAMSQEEDSPYDYLFDQEVAFPISKNASYDLA